MNLSFEERRSFSVTQTFLSEPIPHHRNTDIFLLENFMQYQSVIYDRTTAIIHKHNTTSLYETLTDFISVTFFLSVTLPVVLSFSTLTLNSSRTFHSCLKLLRCLT